MSPVWKYRLIVCVLMIVQATGVLIIAEAGIRSQDILTQESGL